MRLFNLSLVSVLVLASQALSQDRSLFHIYPDLDGWSTSSIGRGATANPTGVVELLAEIPQSLVLGMGQQGAAKGGTCEVSGYRFTLQDQDGSTQEAYSLLARPRDISGVGPDMAATPLYTSGPFQSPQGQAGIASAWLVTVAFQSPVQLPCDSGQIFHGVELAAAPLWPAGDGLSCWLADYLGGAFGSNPRATAPGLAWSVEAGGVPQRVTSVWDMAFISLAPSFAVGTINPGGGRINNTMVAMADTDFGAGGFYPDVSGALRADGLAARVYDSGAPGGQAFVLLSLGPSPSGPIPVAFVSIGDLLVDPLLLILAGQGTIASTPPEIATMQLVPPAGVSPSNIGLTIWWQALTLSTAGQFAFANAAGIKF